jgi:hypothetical protein
MTKSVRCFALHCGSAALFNQVSTVYSELDPVMTLASSLPSVWPSFKTEGPK